VSVADETIKLKERHALVREALRHVDDRYREVLHLVYVEGLKVEETARILGTPEGTVKTRLMRGREALKKVTCTITETVSTTNKPPTMPGNMGAALK
jgi:RNA polymerase sigma-70 factor (ECF subfamily)